MTPSEFNKAISEAWTAMKLAPIASKTYTLTIKKKHAGLPLIDVYTSSFPHVDRSYWLEKITNGNLLVNGKSAEPNLRVVPGYITSHTVIPEPEPKVNTQIQLIHADSQFWVLHKPAPLPVHAGGRYLQHSLTPILQHAFPHLSIHLINRLDANTTGIVLVALNKATAHLLGKQFELREVAKTYLALVEGVPSKNQFTSNASISKEKTSAGGRKIAEGSAASTQFKTLKKWDSKSLLQVTPSSGRTNQIRLHLAHIHHPIIGDLGYKDPAYFETHPLTYPEDSLFLHAWKLEFSHPDHGKPVTFTAPPNKKWEPYI